MSRTFNSIKKAIKRTPIIKKIDLNDGEDPIRLTINPSEETREKIINIVFEDLGKENETNDKEQNNKIEDNEELIINLEKKEVFVPIVGLITDIKLEKEDELPFMDYLFKDPSPEGEMLRNDIIEVIYKVIDKFMDEVSKEEDNNETE